MLQHVYINKIKGYFNNPYQTQNSIFTCNPRENLKRRFLFTYYNYQISTFAIRKQILDVNVLKF